MEKKVAVLMGSDSDLKIMLPAIEKLKEFSIPTKVLILSAHKSPDLAIKFAKTAEEKNFKVIIAAAGMAAHLAGIVAANTNLPVIGVPINCSLNGLDSLFSTVQMPKGVPVLTVAINSSLNAAVAACQILALEDSTLTLKEKLKKMKIELEQEIIEKNKNLSFKH